MIKLIVFPSQSENQVTVLYANCRRVSLMAATIGEGSGEVVMKATILNLLAAMTTIHVGHK
jgi:hypothetical protein